jgi:hypothetical protein
MCLKHTAQHSKGAWQCFNPAFPFHPFAKMIFPANNHKSVVAGNEVIVSETHSALIRSFS